MNNIVAEKKWIEQKLQIPYENLSQSYLRAETALSTNATIAFYLQRGNVSSPLITERLLELNDQFVITHATIGVRTVAADSPSSTQTLNSQIQTWEDPQIFTGTNRVNVGAIFNGSLNFTINRKEYLPAFPVRAFRRVPETQTNAFQKSAGTASTPASTNVANIGANGFPNGLYGFYPMEPTLIDGRQTLDIQILLNASIAFDDASEVTYSVMELRGYLVVNAKS